MSDTRFSVKSTGKGIGQGILRRAVFATAYRLIAKPVIGKTTKTKQFGYSLTIPPSVFHPGLYFSTKFLGEHLLGLDLQRRRMLDMGCGSGILSILGASRGASVTAIDLNPAATDATSNNAARHGFDRDIGIFTGNLYEPLPTHSEFDLIVFNPPFYQGEPGNPAALAWQGGEDYSTLREFIRESGKYLSSTGQIVVILTTEMQMRPILEMFAENGYQVSCLRTRRRLFEILSIWNAIPRS